MLKRIFLGLAARRTVLYATRNWHRVVRKGSNSPSDCRYEMYACLKEAHRQTVSAEFALEKNEREPRNMDVPATGHECASRTTWNVNCKLN